MQVPSLEKRKANFHAVLTELRSHGELRMNCGGGQYRDAGGRIWLSDRLARGGRAVTRKNLAIESTGDDPLYQSQREFRRERPGPYGYRIPLPPGRYRVTLHFAELTYREPGKRCFSVVLEDTLHLTNHDPVAKGAATAGQQAFEAAVTDGFLDIEFLTVLGYPAVAAIEIAAVTEKP